MLLKTLKLNAKEAIRSGAVTSYTYKLAFSAGQGAQYALAAAVSIFIFFIVAGISAISFSRTRALENIR